MTPHTEEIILEMRDVNKHFPGVQALDSVSIQVRKGEVHALVGENGAGKSTLIKILSGAYPKDQGEILLRGKPIEIRDPRHAQALGISTIYQEFNLAPHLTVPENILLGQYPVNGPIVNWREATRRSKEILGRLGIVLPMNVPISQLTVAEQQLVEIAKALARESRVLIMDEPSSVLGFKDLDKLFQVIRSLKESEITVIYISHRLVEVFEIADRVTVLKDGRLVGSQYVSEVTMPQLVKMMIGRDMQDIYPKRKPKLGNVLLEVKNLFRPNELFDISFKLHAGEIIGVAGLRGAGRTELARAIFGADPAKGTILLDGKKIQIRSPHDAIRHRMALATEDRKNQGLFLKQNLRFNVTISGLAEFCLAGFIRFGLEAKKVLGLVSRLAVKTTGLDFLVSNMSGGNQQKVILARWLNIGARVLILDEPTRGIDVGSKQEIYNIMTQLAGQGVGIIMISSELPEILGMSDRILVMHERRMAKEFSRAEATEESIMMYAALHNADLYQSNESAHA